MSARDEQGPDTPLSQQEPPATPPSTPATQRGLTAQTGGSRLTSPTQSPPSQHPEPVAGPASPNRAGAGPETAGDQAAAEAGRAVQALRAQVTRAIVGQRQVVAQVLMGLLAGGHVLIEGLPGVGKTLLVRALAKTFGGSSTRIQFTPDLMPADILGHVMYDLKAGQFTTHRGPVFTNLLLADEINRAPAKTQAALLEVMQEKQITLEGKSIALEPPFMTLATQNPFESEGTYPLPDAQLDRFLLKIRVGYPGPEDELSIVQQVTRGQVGDSLRTDAVATILTREQILTLQTTTSTIRVDHQIAKYAVDLVRATRQWPSVTLGAGPRGSIALIRAARASALLDGRAFVLPDDLKAVAIPALRHRIVLAPNAELEGQTEDTVLQAVMNAVTAPRL